MTSAIPEELLEVFPDDGQPGTKKPKDKVCNKGTIVYYCPVGVVVINYISLKLNFRLG